MKTSEENTNRLPKSPRSDSAHASVPDEVDPLLIRAVNLAYHEEEASVYAGQHPEIFRDEQARWSRIAECVSRVRRGGMSGIRLLDVGVGTGFVPLALKGVVRDHDEFVMTDISPAMLETAKTNLSSVSCKKTYLNLSTEKLDFPGGSFDVISMNSVLHHLPEGREAVARLAGFLRPGGLLIIAHEPNILHFNHPIVGGFDRILRLVKKLRYRNFGPASDSGFTARVNERLLAGGTIKKPMSTEEIESLVDIHSPTAGRAVRAERGFDARTLADDLGLEVVSLETYRHLGKAGPSLLKLLGPLPGWIERRFPDAGALFTVVLRKP